MTQWCPDRERYHSGHRYSNHERSKKHKENVALLKDVLEEEDREMITQQQQTERQTMCLQQQQTEEQTMCLQQQQSKQQTQDNEEEFQEREVSLRPRCNDSSGDGGGCGQSDGDGGGCGKSDCDGGGLSDGKMEEVSRQLSNENLSDSESDHDIIVHDITRYMCNGTILFRTPLD